VTVSSLRAATRIIALAVLGAPLAATAQQTDVSPSLSATYGYGQSVAVYGIGALWHVPWGAETLARHGLDVRLGVDVLRWQVNTQAPGNQFLWNGNVTPYLRWHPADGALRNMFVEIGVGLQLLSNVSLSSSPRFAHDFSTALQFGERIAAGVTFGPRGRYEIAPFFQHVSNGGIKEPNDGLSYFGVTVRMALE
jgi:lipid A 3-O-deacylase